MFRPMGLSRPSHSVRRVLFVLALLVVGLVSNLSLIPSASAAVQDPYAAPFDLWPGLTTAPLVQNDSATDVSLFMRDPNRRDQHPGRMWQLSERYLHQHL